MIFPDHTKVYLYREAMDMRCGFERLSGAAQNVLGQDPFSGHLFLFLNKKFNRMKILYWDKDGWVIWYKRLEKGKFVLPHAKSDQITTTQLAMILEGVDMRSIRHCKRFRR